MSYPVASQVKSYVPPGYEGVDHALVPHGLSVIINAPSVFRFTGKAAPERHLECARILADARNHDGEVRQSALGTKASSSIEIDSGRYLADEILYLMESLGVPIGLRTLGYDESDIEALAEGTLPQHRVTKLSPRPVGKDDLVELFQDALDA